MDQCYCATTFIFLLCLTPDDFICQGKAHEKARNLKDQEESSLVLSCMVLLCNNVYIFTLTPDDSICQEKSAKKGVQ